MHEGVGADAYHEGATRDACSLVRADPDAYMPEGGLLVVYIHERAGHVAQRYEGTNADGYRHLGAGPDA